MKLIITLLTCGMVHASAMSFGQQVTLNVKNATMSEIFKEIRKQTGYDFVYNDGHINTVKRKTVRVKDKSLQELLFELLSTENLRYNITDNSIVVSKRAHSTSIAPDATVQETYVSGTVVDERGVTLVGVVVRELEPAGNATKTDLKGGFVLKVKNKQAIVRFSYVGYKAVEMQVSAIKYPFELKLIPQLNDLDEIQVTAYGNTTKRFNTGNITTITAKDIEKNPVNNVLEALQGKVPGLFIQQATGQPGGAFSMRMRSASNFNTGSAEPLVIVDGVRYPSGILPMNTNAQYDTGSFLQGGSGLNYINPNDIERIDVLKDIDATAIYGSSGAYGVILITTKKAKTASTLVSANVYSGVSIKGKMASILNTEQYLMLRREAFKNDGLEPAATDYDVNGTWPEDRYHDWRTAFLGKAAVTSNANFSYSGGSNNTSFLINGSLRNTGNIQMHRGANKDGSVRFNLNTKSNNNKFDLSVSGSYMGSKNDMVPYDFSSFANVVPPNAPYPLTDKGAVDWSEVGDWARGIGNINRTYLNTTNNLLSNLTLNYRPNEHFVLNTIIGFNNLKGRELSTVPSTVFNPASTSIYNTNVGLLNNFDTQSLTVSPYAEYKNVIWKKGELNIKFGGEINQNTRRSNAITGTGFSADALLSNPALGASKTYTITDNQYRSVGMYGIVKFIWDKKYMLDMNGRRDGSIKFGPSRRFGNFGSAAVGWIFSEETGIKELMPWLSFGKLRASSGIVGGDKIGDYQYLSSYSVLSQTYGGEIGFYPTSLANPLLEWEKNFNSEAAIELGFFKNRISMDASYYLNRSSNQLISQPLSMVTGFGKYTLNSDALLRNTGLEISLSSVNIDHKDFKWNTRFNISLPKSKILKMPSQSSLYSNYVLGKSVNGILTYKYEGVDPQTGMYTFKNAKGEIGEFIGGLSQSDKTEFVDLDPTYYGGLTNTFTVKNFTLDFSFSFTKRIGKSLMGQSGLPMGYYGTNGSTVWLDRWQQPGDITHVPKVSTSIINYLAVLNFNDSNGAYEDATYARLQNVSLRYSVPADLLKKLRLKQLTAYVQGQNLLTISKYGSMDPENLNANVLPPMRVFTAGINLTL
ncbi:SusC/RagA family TonB-linked outer membrane protein [Sphingobacterium faecium]|uniref:SusC/RagA family TonB-linked outer membrane protein n=1 Tax=Sphingobacterium faecium TaxID=34087 RepID=UPI0021B5AEFE|nr:SusC/RagA family TonB-linked outer membrane protein [Sphingobacterium faecium]UXD69399.1 SusC/RagA family TonB-linked outer membrane protein [Sphingobacterium faecium]